MSLADNIRNVNLSDDICKLLERMVESCVEGNEEMVLILNMIYHAVIWDAYPTLPQPLRFEYDNLRESCVMSITMPHMRRQFVADARQRLYELKKD